MPRPTNKENKDKDQRLFPFGENGKRGHNLKPETWNSAKREKHRNLETCAQRN